MRHLHPSAVFFEAARHVRNWIGVLFGGGAVALADGHLPAHTVLAAGMLALISGSVAWGFLSWRAITYEVSGDSLLLRRGVLSKNERTIPLQRIQSVDVVQGVPQRILGVVEVRVETAGGGSRSPDAVLPALSRDAAEALRREIEAPGAGRPPSRILARLSTRELLLAGATSGQIGVALSLIGVVWQAADNFLPEGITLELAERFAPRSPASWAALVSAALLFAWLLSIGGTVLAYSGFTLSREGEILRIRRGLLERNEATIPLSRIQAVRIVEGLLRQPFGLAALRVESAGYGRDTGISTTLFPLLPRRCVHAMLLSAVPEFAADHTLQRPPSRARGRYVVRCVAPACLLAAALVPLLALTARTGFWSLLPATLIPLCVPYGLLCYHDAGWALPEARLLVVRARKLSRTTTIAPLRCLQSRSVVQNPFQRRAQLAGFQASVASGRGGTILGISHLDAGSASALLSRTGPTAAGERLGNPGG